MSGLLRTLPVLALCLLAACSSGAGGGTAEPAGGTAASEVEQVLTALRDVPGVVEATGGYSTRAVDAGAVDIDLTVADTVAAAQRESLLDRAEELVWRSGVDPLETLNVVLGAPGSSELLGERLYQGRTQLQELERRYGPRPG